VNGAAGLIIRSPVGAIGAVGFTVCEGRIATIDLILDPSKLQTIQTR
jgi:RNA polymerase sigma-70 factor (ECF subfamily)